MKRSKTKGTPDNLSRSKSEIEASSRELTELEKETFSIKINDLEIKLQRKQELCNFLENEKRFLEAEYENKKVLKKESMGILNEAYRDFHLESLLLEGELSGMENLTSTALKKRENVHATKRTERLLEVKAKLERKLSEVERNVNDIPDLSRQFQELEKEIFKRNVNFKNQMENLRNDFASFMKRLQEDLKSLIEKIIQDNNLKLHLLPVPYQALFESGMLGYAWFKSVLETCESVLQQNREMIETTAQIKASCQNVYESSQKALYVIVLSNQAKELFKTLNQDLDQMERKQKFTFPDTLLELESDMKYLLKLNSMNLYFENCIIELSNKIQKLEKNIEHENVDQYEGKSHLLEVIMQAKDIIIQEL